MPVHLLRPAGIGDNNAWLLGAGASKNAATDPGDPLSHDDDTTYIHGDLNEIQELTLGAMPAGATGVRGITGNFRWRSPNDNSMTVRFNMKLGGVLNTNFDSTQNSSASYSDILIDPLTKPNGGDWTLEDLADSTLQLRLTCVTNPIIARLRVTSAWLAVQFVQSAIIPYDAQTGSVRVVMFSQDVALYAIKVHHRFISNELVIDLMNLAESAIPLAPSVLDNLQDHNLLEKWRRKIVVPVGQRYLPSEHAVEMFLLDYEPIAATYFSTLTSPYGTPGDTLDGVARYDIGATYTVERSSDAFVRSETDVVGITSDGQNYRRVADGREKINHEGLLTEQGVEQTLLNNVFRDGTFTSWTNVLNGGTINADTFQLVFPSDVSGQVANISRPNNSNDTYIEQSIAVLSSESFRRIHVVYENWFDTTSRPALAIQRDSDSNWWNDATGLWQASKVWLHAANVFDGAAGNVNWSEFYTKPMNITSNQNWLIQVGLEGADSPAGQMNVQISYVGCTVGRFRYSPIPTYTAARTTASDQIRGALDVDPSDPVRQMHYAGRGTISFEFTAQQDGTDLEDGDEMALVFVQYEKTVAATAADEFDVVLYQKLAGQNVRFTYERWIAGSLDARATRDVSIVFGTTYRIRAIATSDSDGELGLAARTLRIGVDEVAGTDDQASATHSLTERETEVYIGCANESNSYIQAHNFIRRLRLQPRVVPFDEKIV